jgi:hypothetical protein
MPRYPGSSEEPDGSVTVTAVSVAPMAMTAVLIGRSNEIGWLGSAFTPEELLELGHPNSLALFTGDVQTVLVDQHLRVLEPLPPGRLGYGVEDLLPEFTFERRLFQTFGLLTKLDALNGS